MWLRGSAASGGPLKAIVNLNGEEGSRRPSDEEIWGVRDGGRQQGVKAIKRPSDRSYRRRNSLEGLLRGGQYCTVRERSGTAVGLFKCGSTLK